MTRTSQLLVVAACVLAFAATAWIALSAARVTDLPVAVVRADAPRTVEADQVPPRSRGESARARVRDARRKPAISSAQWIVHVVAAEDGAPIEGAKADVSGAPDWPRSVSVDADGEVRVEASVLELTPAIVALRLSVAAPGRVREIVLADLASGAEKEETIRLRRAFGVDGIVHDAADRPIAGARVTAKEKKIDAASGAAADAASPDALEFGPELGGRREPRPELATAVSGDDGRFRIEGLPIRSPIDYEVAAPRHVTKRIARRAHDAHPLDVRLDAAGLLRGVVRSPAGDPVAGARVTASPAAPEKALPDAEWSGAPSGPDGRYEIDGLPFGAAFTLVAEHDAYMDSAESAPIRLTPERSEAFCDLALRPAGHLEVELASAVAHGARVAKLRWDDGEETTTCSVPGRATRIVRVPGSVVFDVCGAGLRHVEATAEIGPGETRTVKVDLDEGGPLSGIVVDDEGTPVGGAVVTVDPEELSQQRATSAADGTFAMKGLVPAIHEVRTTAAGHAASDKTGLAASVTWMRIEVPRDGEAALRLRVPDGAARPSKRRIAWLGPEPVDEDVARWTDGEISCSLPPGDWRIEVDVTGYVKWRPHRLLSIVSGYRTDLGEIVLERGLPLAGRVVDPEGHAVPDVDVFIGADVVETDSTGAFRAEHVAAGYHDVGTRASPDFLATSVRTILADDSEPVVLTLQRGAVLRVELRGKVTAAAGPGTRVDVLPIDPPVDAAHVGRASLFQEASDSYSARLSASARRIVVYGGGKLLATKDVVLREGDDVTVEIDLGK